jgi:hypothetical protein
MLCKPLKKYDYEEDIFESVNAYTFYKPITPKIPFRDALRLANQICSNRTNTKIKLFWNNSMYPLLVISRGNDFNSVVDCIRDFRVKSTWAVDSCSYITLRIDPETCWPVEDQKNGNVPVVISYKLSNYARA